MNIASILLCRFHHFREYSLKVNKHVCNPEAILLDTYDFRFSIIFVESYISAIHGCNTTAIFVQDLATREECWKCITFFHYYRFDYPIFQQYSSKIYQHASNVKYKIIFFCTTPIALNIEAISPQYGFDIFSIFVNDSSTLVYICM